MNNPKHLVIAVLALGSVACAPRGPSVSKQTVALSRDASLLRDLAQGQETRPVERAELVERLATADLASIGESHEDGLERRVLAGVYSDLFARAGSPRRCLVESYDSLIGRDGAPETPGREDPLRPVFNAGCKREAIFDNDSWDYSSELARVFGGHRRSGELVLSHTGYRHVFPMGKLFGAEFEPHPWVDQNERGTIARQLPEGFERSGRKARSFAPLALDSLAVAFLGRELVRGNAPVEVSARLEALLDSPSLRLGDSEALRIFELKRVARAIPHLEAYVGVFDPGILKREALRRLLSSGELAAFLAESRGRKLFFGYFRGGDGATFSLGGRQLSSSGIVFLSLGEQYLYVDSTLAVVRFSDSQRR